MHTRVLLLLHGSYSTGNAAYFLTKVADHKYQPIDEEERMTIRSDPRSALKDAPEQHVAAKKQLLC